MSAGYQKFVLVGNLGGDPEMRYTPSGQAVTNFSLAINNSHTDKSTGEVVESTTWFRISVWGNQAETCNQYLTKGRQVLVEGKLVADKETGGPRIWTDQNGKARASFEVSAFDVRFLGASNGNSNGQSVRAQAEAQAIDLSEDEIPF